MTPNPKALPSDLPPSPRGPSNVVELARALDDARRELAVARGPLGRQRVVVDALLRGLPSFEPDELAAAVDAGARPAGLDAEGWLFANAVLAGARVERAPHPPAGPPAAEHRERTLEALLWSLAQAGDEEHLCRTVMEFAREHLGAERVSLVRPVGDGEVLEVLGLAGQEGRLVAGTRLPRANSGVGSVFETGEVSHRSIEPSSECIEDDVLRSAGLRTTLGVPVRCGGPSWRRSTWRRRASPASSPRTRRCSRAWDSSSAPFGSRGANGAKPTRHARAPRPPVATRASSSRP